MHYPRWAAARRNTCGSCSPPRRTVRHAGFAGPHAAPAWRANPGDRRRYADRGAHATAAVPHHLRPRRGHCRSRPGPRGGMGRCRAALVRAHTPRRHSRPPDPPRRPGRRHELRLSVSVRRHALPAAAAIAPGARGGVRSSARMAHPTPGRGASGAGRNVVAFSAICAHKLAYPTREVSFIRYQRESSATSSARVIHCCADHSVYDPAQGARVVAGPAPQPLAGIVLEYDTAGRRHPRARHRRRRAVRCVLREIPGEARARIRTGTRACGRVRHVHPARTDELLPDYRAVLIAVPGADCAPSWRRER